MSDLPGYDAWKTHDPDDDRCEFCGVHPRECRKGWRPDRCTGECGATWRDPDAEYERRRDDDAMQRALEADGEKLRQLTGEDHGEDGEP